MKAVYSVLLAGVTVVYCSVNLISDGRGFVVEKELT